MKNENYKEEDYKKNFKFKCVSCGKPIKRYKQTKWEYYQIYGNYCPKCTSRATFNSLDKERQRDIKEFGKFLELLWKK